MNKFAIRFGLVALLALIVLAPSADARMGSVRVTITKAALLAGAGVGHGVLTFDGREYPFRVYGLSVGVTIGASIAKLAGWASYLHELSDFEGDYTSAGLGAALIGGAGGVQLKNQKGVIITLHGARAGLEFAANLSDVRIAFE
jgi:hypothetical protein